VFVGKNRMIVFFLIHLGRKMKWFIIVLTVMSSSSVFAQNWEYHRDYDDFDDTDRSMVIPFGSNRDNTAAAIGFKCFSDGINLLVVHGYMIGDSDDEVRVRYRVDKNEPYGPAYWSLQPSSKSSFAPMRVVPELISEMKAGTKLVIQVTDPGDGDVKKGVFSLVGFSSEIQKLESSCIEANR
jgi:hypothetical protein